MKRNEIWKKEDKRLEKYEKTLLIPPFNLKKVASITLKKAKDFKRIPKTGGCYWIWTNEPIIHTLHKGTLPKRFNNGEIIYNGIAKDNVGARIVHHLFNKDIDEGWSGVSIDVYPKKSKSHNKKIMSPNGKVPYINKAPIRKKVSIFQLNLSRKEKQFIKTTPKKIFYFRNGINIFESKHKRYKYIVFFITSLSSKCYLEFIEKKWREKCGVPRLCSYISGR